MQCPYCGEQHPANAQFCPRTGKILSLPQNRLNRLYLGIGVCSVLLMTISIFMLLATKHLDGRFVGLLAGSGSGNPADQTSVQLTTQQSQFTEIPTLIPRPTLTPTQTPVPVPSPIDLKVNSKDSADIVLIPAGEFLMGSNHADDPYFWGAEEPEHTVTLDAFWIYRTEVTQGMYQRCVEEKACPIPERIKDPIAEQYGNPQFSNYPVVMVTWKASLAYCQWAGARLPTEAEWEKAARGTDGRLFPWGNNSDWNGLANFLSSSTMPVGSYPTGASPYSVYDMAGNVLEWVHDFFQPSYYRSSPLNNPLGPISGNRRVIRGGAFNQTEVAGLRTVARASLRPTDTKISVGFRCVVDDQK